MEDIRKFVEEKYSQAIRNKSCCCGSSSGGCCSGGGSSITSGIYDPKTLEKLPPAMREQSFGCGSPTAGAGIHPGEVVLDLGSGAGIDTFLASELTGPFGKVYGLDMTDAMLETARANAAGLGIENVTYIRGTIESIPLSDESVDVILSNCVINLSPDKAAVLREAFRVLRPGGRMSVSDMVFLAPVADSVRGSLEAWAGCVAGATQVEDLRVLLGEAGFEEIRVLPERVFHFDGEMAREMFSDLSPEAMESIDGVLASAAVTARKPAIHWEAGKDFTVRKALSPDLVSVGVLLAECGLPLEGVPEHLETFLVAERNGRVIGSAGLEVVQKAALLRSVAVEPDARKRGVGEALVGRALAMARSLDADRAYLLTEAAADWFSTQGFTAVARETMPAALRFSSALEGICPLSSTCMEIRF